MAAPVDTHTSAVGDAIRGGERAQKNEKVTGKVDNGKESRSPHRIRDYGDPPGMTEEKPVQRRRRRSKDPPPVKKEQPKRRPRSQDVSAQEEASVRRRRVRTDSFPQREAPPSPQEGAVPAVTGRSSSSLPDPTSALLGSYWLVRIVLLRGISLIYCVAFWDAFFQNTLLMGDQGLLPCKLYLETIKLHNGGKINIAALHYAPTLLWFLPWSCMDCCLDGLALLGFLLSALVLITGRANMVCMAILWILYLSLVNVGQIWYIFGLDNMLLETGFLAIFLCPLWTFKQLPEHSPTSKIVIWAFRWFIFRLMIGMGFNKLTGDPCWRNFTCMEYHHETQMLPNPTSYYLHQMPSFFHTLQTLAILFSELVVPFFLFMGRRMRTLAGVLLIAFQVAQTLDGNLGFQNWLIIVLCAACFDDVTIGLFLPSGKGTVMNRALHLVKPRAGESVPVMPIGGSPPPSTNRRSSPPAPHGVSTAPTLNRNAATPVPTGFSLRLFVNIGLGLLIAYLSLPLLWNQLGFPEISDNIFRPFRLVSKYRCFSKITKERTEVILLGTSDPYHDSPSAVWEEYEFKCKPGDLARRPCFLSPFHYRLDWHMWYAAMLTYEQNEWVIHLAGKILAAGNGTSPYLRHNPFLGKKPPRWIKGEHFKYKFSRMGGKHANKGKWWLRKHIGPYLPPLDTGGLKMYFSHRGWRYPPQP